MIITPSCLIPNVKIDNGSSLQATGAESGRIPPRYSEATIIPCGSAGWRGAQRTRLYSTRTLPLILMQVSEPSTLV